MKILMVYFVSLITWFAFQVLQGVDFDRLADKYGVPTAFSMVILAVMLWTVRRSDRDRNEYLKFITDQNEKTNQILNAQLAEARKTNAFCRYNATEVDKNG